MYSYLGILIPLLLVAASGHIIWKSTDGFEIAANYLGRKMTRGVKGATINAIASSMPEFLTTMFFLFYIREDSGFIDRFSGSLGVVAGSAIFNILIIPLVVLIFILLNMRNVRVEIKSGLVFRDGMYLILTNIILIAIILKDELSTVHALMLIVIYLVYLLLLRGGYGSKSTEPENSSDFTVPRVKIGWSHVLRLDIKQILLNGKTLNRTNAWITILASTLVMGLGTWLLVEGTYDLGKDRYDWLGLQNLQGLDLPVVFLSVVLAAAATSIPDTMISLRDARNFNFDDSISNAIGSNIFDISLAIGMPLLIYTSLYHNLAMSEYVRLWSVGILIYMGLTNLLVIIILTFKKISLKIKVGILALLYLFFLLMIVFESRFSWYIDFISRLDAIIR